MRVSLAGPVAGAIVALTLSSCAGTAGAPEGAPGPVTATGRVVDLVCYTRNASENAGMDHDDGFACAMACVKWEGNPVGLLTDDGQLYQFAGGLVANNNEKIAQYVAQRVTVTGDAFEEAGMMMLSADEAALAE